MLPLPLPLAAVMFMLPIAGPRELVDQAPAEPPATAPPLTPAQAELLQKIKRLRDGDSRHLHIQPSPPRAEALQLV